MIGCDIRAMDEATQSILLNRDVLAINQDPKGCQPFFANSCTWKPNEARRSSTEPHFERYPLEMPIIAKYLDNGDIAVGLFNLTDREANRWDLTLTCDQLGLPRRCGKTLEAVNLWTGETIPFDDGALEVSSLAPHACLLLRVKVIDQ